MQVIETPDDLSKDPCSLLKPEDFALLLGLEIEQVPAIAILTDQIGKLLILFRFEKFHYIGRVETLHTVNLAVEVILQVGLLQQSLLGYQFESIELSLAILY